MPKVKATLDINTIGDWSFGVDGTCKFTTIEIEVSILIKSHKGAPIPDKLYFYIAGFERVSTSIGSACCGSPAARRI